MHVGETAEAAILRELQEELQIMPRIVRPLWLNQAFFTEDATRTNYHELCLYFFDRRVRFRPTGRRDVYPAGGDPRRSFDL